MNHSITLNSDDERISHLCRNDAKLAALISLIGELTFNVRSSHFESLVLSIVGQQLSVKAAATINNRVKSLVSAITPEEIDRLDPELLRSAGLSSAKINYIKDLSGKLLRQEIDLTLLPQLEDREVVEMLTKVKGIGQWTAEMFLIFSLGRMNVVSLGDVGLVRGARWLYSAENKKDGNPLAQHAHKWSPYCSVASLYLWEAVNRGYVDSGKTVEELVSG
ncbi:DNA-3-methyladenine glycosylase family protein [Paenibacillus ehimensis]|uniref:DNA-3-methyladenine glycosylase II n=1 Tax=Paenibacillus ehimensis TaxID=79264 RepID=A0ABT8VLT2_9BACL|nr:DNA-3-methyladenine glycosylase [Paenibacillus ehimensis]MDO3681935.1 DNA-3-methyladenine glycosylase [Paenibacillus ehimensis]MEC0211673.1 DNA-3-methyladenine glycosylase [Paenibacillus ehimensis]